MALALVAVMAAACTREVEKQVVVEKQVIKEVPVERIVEKQVIKEVPVEKIVVVEKQVIKEVPVEKIVEKVVIKEVPVEKVVVVTKEVVKEVPKEVVVVKEVVKEVIKEVIVEVPAKAKEKVVTIARGTPATLMPHNARASVQQNVYDWAFSYLLMPDPIKQEWSPDLAERWSVSADGTSWTFFIRKNAVWEDGKPVTAKDVAFTLKSYLTPATVSRFLSNLQGIKGALEYIDGKATEIPGLVLVDDYTLRVDLKEPDAFFLLKLTGIGGTAPVPMLPAHILAAIPPKDLITSKYFTEKPITSGAYHIVAYKVDQFIEYKANDNYYFGRPKLDRIIARQIATADAVQIGLQRGEIDLAMYCCTPQVNQVFINDPRYVVVSNQGVVPVAYGWNYKREYLRDPRIHQAFLYALDRKTLVDVFNDGNGKIINTGPTQSWWHKPEYYALYPYDPDKARQLLKDAGWDPKREVDVTIGTLSTEAARAAVAAEQQMLAAVGFKLKFRELDAAAAAQVSLVTRDFDLERGGFGISADPDGWVTNRFSLLATNNYSYGNDKLEALILAGRRAPSQAERTKVYQEMFEKQLLVDLPITPLYVVNDFHVKSKKFSIPLFDQLPEATSLTTIPRISTFTGKDWPKWHNEQWDLKN